MEKPNSRDLRYLAASMIRNASLRQEIIDLVEAERRAFAPEVDTELATLARLTYLLAGRERRYDHGFFALVVVAGLLAFFQLWLAAFVLIVGGWALALYKTLDERYNLLPFVRTYPANLAGLEQYLAQRYKIEDQDKLPDQSQNLVVYSGFSPFIGVGHPLGGWSFPVTINQPKEEFGQALEIIPFKLAELYAAVEESLADCRFAEFTTRDLLFVNGKHIRDKDWILPDLAERPVTHVDEARVAEYLEASDPLIRYYKWLYMYDWGHEIIVSYFVRFSITGAHLFVEANRFLLTPLAEKYREIDLDRLPTFADLIKTGAAAIWGGLLAIPSALAVLGYMMEAVNKFDLFGLKAGNKAREISQNVLYDYGATTSLREKVSGGNYRHYFQTLDKEMYVKVFEKQILIAIRAFLDDHHIDTSDIKERQTTILNNGVFIQGGEMKAEALAVGAGAQSIVRSN